MNSRERVRCALSHREPDRLPIDLGGSPFSGAPEEIQKRMADILGLRGERDPGFPEFDNRIQEHFGCDLRFIRPAGKVSWGFRKITDAPLATATLDDLDRYAWPVPEDRMVSGLDEKARFLDRSGYAVCVSQIGQGLFEMGCWLRGFSQWLLDIALDEPFVHAFCRKVLDANIRLGDLYYSVVGPYADLVMIGDDYAMQTNTFISLETFRGIFKPYFAEYVASVRRWCPHARITHHCCGSSFRLLDDFAEIGIEVINPVQTTAEGMAPENLAAKKPRLAFHGGGDLQHILPHGTIAEVESFTRNLVAKLGQGGGFILAPCHYVPEDVKPENLIAMFEAGRRCGDSRSRR